VNFKGCFIEDRCIALGSTFEDIELARVESTAGLVAEYRKGATPPKGVRTVMKNLDLALGELTGSERCDVVISSESAGFRRFATSSSSARTPARRRARR